MRYLRFAAAPSLALLFACSRSSPQSMQGQYEEVLDEQYVHKYGVAVPPDFWESSGEDGAVVSTRADGVVVSRSYKGGILDGETSYTFPHSSQICKREVYSQGALTKSIELHTEGTPKNEAIFNAPQQGMQTFSTWYISGAPKSVEQYRGQQLVSGTYSSIDNQPDGIVENGAGTRLLRDDYGQLTCVDTISNGSLTMRQSCHANNLPKEKIPYRNQAVHGTKQTFYPGGEPNTIEQWEDGRQQGTTTVFFHGEKYAEVPYINGMKKGTERRYRDGNELVQELTWHNDQLHGPAVTYVDGEPAKTEWFYRGAPTTEENFNFMTNRPNK